MKKSITNKLENLGAFKDFSDGSIKTVLRTMDGGIIELTLLFNKPDMDVICIPTHHFCNLGCKMCHLTNKGLNKDMIPVKSDDMVEAIVKSACYSLDNSLVDAEILNSELFKRRTNKKKLLLSFMGVGEPLLNLRLIEELILKEEYFKDVLQYCEIGYALATMIPNNNIVKLTELVVKHQVSMKVHFSMHSPYDEERFNLIPSTKTTIEEALVQLLKYKNEVFQYNRIKDEYKKFHTSDEPIEIHYTLIKDINDSESHLNEMINYLEKYPMPIKFIRFNPVNDLESSNMEEIWVKEIQNRIPDLRVKTYSPPGREIGSSCGEFTKHYYHEEIESDEQLKEFLEWEKKHKIYENYRKDYITWDEYYMGVAILSSKRSKDPSTQVGACVVSNNNRILSVGYNGTPNAINDECFNWGKDGDKYENKYAYVIHAEVNAILNFHGNMKELSGATMYVTLFPCNECAKFIVQSGIKKIIYLSDKYGNKKETIAAKKIFDNCGVKYIKYEQKKEKITISFKEDMF